VQREAEALAKENYTYKFERRSSGGSSNAPEYMTNFFRKKTAELATTRRDKKAKNRTSRFSRASQRRMPEKTFTMNGDMLVSAAGNSKASPNRLAKIFASVSVWFAKKLFNLGNVKVTRLSFVVCLFLASGMIGGGVALASSVGPVAVMNLFETKKLVSIQYGSVAGNIETTADTVRELITEQGIELGEYDEVVPGLDTVIEDGMLIDINRAFDVTVTSAGKTHTLRLTGGTVEDALKKANIRYDGDDRIEPGLKEELSRGMQIEHTAIAYTTIYERSEIDYEVIHEDNDTIEEGYFAIGQEGQNGVLLTTIKVCYENGEEVSRELISQEIESEPVPKIILDGTVKKSSHTSKGSSEYDDITVTNPGQQATNPSVPSGPGDYLKEFIAEEVTAYSHTGRKTATGTWPRSTRTKENPGSCAVNPDVIPYGSLLYVPGYGYCIAEDTGGFRKKRPTQIDLFMNTEAECKIWGRRDDVTVYILRLGY